MTKTFAAVGKTTTESVDANQLVWVLLPKTLRPAVIATYSRQLHPGVKVLLRLGSVRNIFNNHLLPLLNSLGDRSCESKRQELAMLTSHVDAMAGDVRKRVQIFLSFLSSLRLIKRKLYPIIEKVSKKAPLTGKDITPVVDALYAKLRKSAEATLSHKQKIRRYIQTGTYDTTTMLWLALVVDPGFALHLWRDSLAAECNDSQADHRLNNLAGLERGLKRAVEQIRAGGECAGEICGIDLRGWLTEMIGCAPQTRFFVEVENTHQGLNRMGCLNFDQSKTFQDFGDDAPKLVTLDKLARTVTALDRTLAHLLIAFANDDVEMTELCQNHPIHSGLLLRGLLGDGEAIRTLYPFNAMAIPNHAELSELLVAKTRTAYQDGSLARVCALHYRMSEDDLRQGLNRTVSIQRKILLLVPMEVHRLADAIEARIRLRKIAERVDAEGGRSMNHQQRTSLEIALRGQTVRQTEISKTLKADFRIDPTKLFYIDDLLIDRIKALFGDELEFMRRILAGYIERTNASKQAGTDGAGSGSAVNG